MTLFSYNRFVIEDAGGSPVHPSIYNYLQMLRANALGNFKTLTRKSPSSAPPC